MVTPMTLGRTMPSFFFHVGELAASCHFAVASEDATAAERGETKKPNETHMMPPLRASVSKRCAAAAGEKAAQARMPQTGLAQKYRHPPSLVQGLSKEFWGCGRTCPVLWISIHKFGCQPVDNAQGTDQ
jgi:hypothetical protein